MCDNHGRPVLSQDTQRIEETKRIQVQVRDYARIAESYKTEMIRAQAGQVYSFHEEAWPIFVQGDKAMELCELVTAEYVQKWYDMAHLPDLKIATNDIVAVLTKEEAQFLNMLLRGYVVGPAGRTILEKIAKAAR